MSQPSAMPARRSRRTAGLLALAVAAGTAAAAVALGRLPSVLALPDSGRPGLGASGAGGSPESFVSALSEALVSVEGMQAEVAKGHVVGRYGEKAQFLMATAVRAAGSAAGSDLGRALDGALQAVFLQQLALIRHQVFNRFKEPGRQRPQDVLARADRAFVAQASPLVRPGSDWSYEPERSALLASLASEVRQARKVVDERSRIAQTQRVTADVIGKLQKQMEQLGEKVRGTSAGSPWVLWTSYRLPGTPFQMSGRYQQGRANIELNLSPNRDPANAEAGMVEGLTATNLGLSFNIGV